MKHALIIGGTGMLRDVSMWLNHNGYTTTILARNPQKLKDLGKHFTSNYELISLDYTHTLELKRMVQSTIQKFGKINMVVAWVHSIAPDAIPTVLTTIEENQVEPYDLYEIRGSSSYLEDIQFIRTVPSRCHYHMIQLGFILENNSSRWLTHHEIAEGVTAAIKNRNMRKVVGQLEPWDRRP